MRRFLSVILLLLSTGGLLSTVGMASTGGLLSGQTGEPTAGELYHHHLNALNKGNFDSAEVHLIKILSRFKDLPLYNRALVHNGLGWVYYETSRFNAALRHYLLADSLITATGTETIPLKISIHNNLGLLYNWLGEYTLTRDHFEKAYHLLDLLTEHDSVYFGKLSMLQFNRGVLMYLLEEHTEAISLLKESEQIKKTHGQTHLGSVYYNLARVSEALHKTDTAAGYYRKAIARWISEYNEDHFQLANIYQDFGLLQISNGSNEEGLKLLEAALSNYLENYGSRHPLTAGCYENLGRFYLDQSDYQKAMEHLQKALIAATRQFSSEDPEDNPVCTEGLHDLTLLKILQSKVLVLERSATNSAGERKRDLLKLATRTNHLSIRVLYRIQGSYLTGESRTYLIARQKGVFETGIRIYRQLWSETGNVAYLDSAYLDAAKGKANELLLERRIKEWLFLESLPDSMARSVVNLKLQADHLSHLIQAKSREVDPDSALLNEWRNQLFELRDSFRSEMDLLQGEQPLMSQFEYLSRHLTMENIRKKLSRGETLVEFFSGDPEATEIPQIHSFVVTKGSTHLLNFSFDENIVKDLEIVMENLHEFDPLRETKERYDRLILALYQLHRQLIEPLEPHLEGEKIILVPDGRLSYLPFDALLTEKPSGPAMNYSGLPYLIHKYQISYAYHSIITRDRQLTPVRFPELSAWAPSYDSAGQNGWGPLEGAEDEVRAIVEMTGGKALRGELNREEVLALLQARGIIHLATHAVAPDNPGSSPYFVLNAGSGGGEPERIHDYEIQSMAAPSSLVVLSGCETAGGYEQKGEGVLNLSRSFLQAGARSVVHSLWPVVDPNASKILVDFYRGLKLGNSRTASLRRAKINYLEEASPSYTHPHYWATLQITGDPGPVRMKWWNWLAGLIALSGFILALIRIYYLLKRRRSFKSASASSL